MADKLRNQLVRTLRAKFEPTDQIVERFAFSPDNAALVSGLTRTRIFDAIKNKELTARRAGKRTVIEAAELRRWIESLPTIGREGAA